MKFQIDHMLRDHSIIKYFTSINHYIVEVIVKMLHTIANYNILRYPFEVLTVFLRVKMQTVFNFRWKCSHLVIIFAI